MKQEFVSTISSLLPLFPYVGWKGARKNVNSLYALDHKKSHLVFKCFNRLPCETKNIIKKGKRQRLQEKYVHEEEAHTTKNWEFFAGPITEPVKPINHVGYSQYLLIQ